MTNDEKHVADIFTEVEVEIAVGGNRHPGYPGMADPVRAVGIVAEEVGEAMKEALDLTRGYPCLLMLAGPERDAAKRRLYNETVQVAATAVRLLLAIREHDNG